MNRNNHSTRPTPTALFKIAADTHKRYANTAQHKRILVGACLRHSQVRQAYLALVKAAQRACPEEATPFISVSDYSAAIDSGVALRDLDSFKDTRLLKVLDTFAAGDWDASSSDYTYDQPNRDYRFKRTIDRPLDTLRLTAAERRSLSWLDTHASYSIPTELTLTVGIYAYVKADSDACRIEVVGIEEEVIKKEIKRIVCA